MDLGFLGLGQMGAAIAERLAQAGARLHVFDPDPVAIAPFLLNGAVDHASARAVGDAAPIVFACLPGAAINPFYSAVRADGTLSHTLARHVEGAAHMAEGYTRAKAGNIGVCVGTSGPAGTDMINIKKDLHLDPFKLKMKF